MSSGINQCSTLSQFMLLFDFIILFAIMLFLRPHNLIRTKDALFIFFRSFFLLREIVIKSLFTVDSSICGLNIHHKRIFLYTFIYPGYKDNSERTILL